MWHDHEPAVSMVAADFYNTNFFTTGAVEAIASRNTSKPFWMHMLHQAVHTGAHRSPPGWELFSTPGHPDKEHPDYISALYVLDVGIGNLTAAMKRAGMWDNTVFMLTADNVSSVHIPVKLATTCISGSDLR
eukprot:COSAG01_NODE_14575_length_1436_cov_1.843680_1_plen_131_part_10